MPPGRNAPSDRTKRRKKKVDDTLKMAASYSPPRRAGGKPVQAVRAREAEVDRLISKVSEVDRETRSPVGGSRQMGPTSTAKTVKQAKQQKLLARRSRLIRRLNESENLTLKQVKQIERQLEDINRTLSTGIAGRDTSELPGAELRTSDAIAGIRAREDLTLGESWGSTLQSVGEGLREGVDFLTGIPTFIEDPSLENAAWVAASVPAPFIKAGATAGKIAAKSGKKAARQFPTGTPYIGKPSERTYKAGELEVTIPGAATKTGKIVESGYDLALGAKGRARRAMKETQREAETVQDLSVGKATELQRAGAKLNNGQQVALRVIAEGASIPKRLAHHRKWANKTSGREKLAHQMQIRLLKQAEQYIDYVPAAQAPQAYRMLATGADMRAQIPVLKAGVSEKFRRTHDLFFSASETRDDMLQAMDLLPSGRRVRRLDAPGRVIEGAEWMSIGDIKKELRALRAKGQKRGRNPLPGDETRRRQLQAALADARMTKEGGTLVGAPKTHAGRAYAGYDPGLPGVPYGSPRLMASYARHAVSGGWGRATRAVTRDPNLTNMFKGHLLESGLFRSDITELGAQNLARAARLASMVHVRKALLQAAKDAPSSIDDIPILVNPAANTPPELKDFWTRWEAMSTRGIGRADVEGVSDETLEKAIKWLFPDTGVHPQGGLAGSTRLEQAARKLTPEEFAATPDPSMVKWLPRDLFDELTMFNPQAGKVNLGKGVTGKLAKTLGIGIDLYNDLQRFSILYMNPAYGPLNLASNAVLNVMQQGPFVFSNWHRSWELLTKSEELQTIRVIMGRGHTQALGLTSQGLRQATHWPGKIISEVSDTFPRLAAFSHEARRYGYKSVEDIDHLIRRARHGDPEAVKDIDNIKRRANDAILDYDRLSPFERNVLARVFFFYPFLKAASRGTLVSAREHPIQTGLLAYGAYEGHEYANEVLGDRPFYAQADIPIPGMEDEFGNPMVMNPRQIFPQSVLPELGATAYGFLTGDEYFPALGSAYTPFIESAMIASTGYDPFFRREVDTGIGTFLDQSIDALAPVRFAKGFEDAGDRNRVYPRDTTDEVFRMFGGRVAPAPYNVQEARGRAKEARGDRVTAAEEEAAWQQRVQKFLANNGLNEIPTGVLKARDAYVRVRNGEDALKNHLGVETLTPKQRLAVRLSVFYEVQPESQELRPVHEQMLERVSPMEAEQVIRDVEDAIGFGILREVMGEVSTWEREVAEGKWLQEHRP